MPGHAIGVRGRGESKLIDLLLGCWVKVEPFTETRGI